MRKYTCAILCFVVSQSLFAQWSGSTTTTGYINRQGKVILNSTGWDSHLEVSRSGYGGVFKPDNSPGYQGLRLDLIGTGSSFYVLNGKVGIGTTAPSEELHVVGDIRLSGTARKLVVGSEGIINDYLLLQDVGVGPAFQWVQDGAPKFSIEGVTGNVGIGTTSPDAKLAVKGTVHAEEVKVDLSVPGPDYVFEDSYPLQSLEEIESYVKANKHLPDVPSAMEMEEEGIKVGEMNMLLLRKIEEMMLHMLQMKTEIKLQKEEIEKLKSQLK